MSAQYIFELIFQPQGHVALGNRWFRLGEYALVSHEKLWNKRTIEMYSTEVYRTGF